MLTKEHRENISLAMKGRKLSKEHTRKLKEVAKGNRGKEKNGMWKDGRTYKRTLEYQEKVAGRIRPKRCEVCNENGRICFDHNHETGEFRGWLCYRCNLALGLLKDNSRLLIELSKYLNK